MSVCVWTFAFVAAFAQSVQEFDECSVGENVGMKSVSFAGRNSFGARDFGRAQDGCQGERHPVRVIFVGAAPIIFSCCTDLALGQAGSVVAKRIVKFMLEIMMVIKKGKMCDTHINRRSLGQIAM